MKYLCILAAVTLLGQGPRVAPTEIEADTVAPLAGSDWPVLVPVYEDFAFDTGDGPTLTIMGPGRWDRTKPLVTINVIGQVRPGEGYTPDAAARAFWAAMESGNPLRAEVERLRAELRKCESTPRSVGTIESVPAAQR